MKAIILAGGNGSRLTPYTNHLPKPLMPLSGTPILDLITRQLAHHEITDITLAVGYMSEKFISYFGNGEQFGVRISYSLENEPLGTAGPLGLVPGLSERFLVMNSDILTTLDFSEMLKSHVASGALGTVAVHPEQIDVDLGVVEHNAQLQLTGYTEKPVHRYLASMGIYIFEPRVVDYIPPNQRLDLPELIKRLTAAGEEIRCYPYDGYWLDIGSPDDYDRAVADIGMLLPRLFARS